MKYIFFLFFLTSISFADTEMRRQLEEIAEVHGFASQYEVMDINVFEEDVESEVYACAEVHRRYRLAKRYFEDLDEFHKRYGRLMKRPRPTSKTWVKRVETLTKVIRWTYIKILTVYPYALDLPVESWRKANSDWMEEGGASAVGACLQQGAYEVKTLPLRPFRQCEGELTKPEYTEEINFDKFAFRFCTYRTQTFRYCDQSGADMYVTITTSFHSKENRAVVLPIIFNQASIIKNTVGRKTTYRQRMEYEGRKKVASIEFKKDHGMVYWIRLISRDRGVIRQRMSCRK